MPRNIQSVLSTENHTLRNNTGMEFRYAIIQNRIRRSNDESSPSQTLEHILKRPEKIYTQTVPKFTYLNI